MRTEQIQWHDPASILPDEGRKVLAEVAIEGTKSSIVWEVNFDGVEWRPPGWNYPVRGAVIAWAYWPKGTRHMGEVL